jgi:hypothetical protein
MYNRRCLIAAASLMGQRPAPQVHDAACHNTGAGAMVGLTPDVPQVERADQQEHEKNNGASDVPSTSVVHVGVHPYHLLLASTSPGDTPDRPVVSQGPNLRPCGAQRALQPPSAPFQCEG